MAFADSEKYQITRLLGYPLKTVISGTTHFSNIFNDRFSNLPTEAEDEVRSIVDRIVALDDKLDSGVTKAGIKRIEDIEFHGSAELSALTQLRSERKRLLKELSQMLDIPYSGGGSMVNVCL